MPIRLVCSGSYGNNGVCEGKLVKELIGRIENAFEIGFFEVCVGKLLHNFIYERGERKFNVKGVENIGNKSPYR